MANERFLIEGEFGEITIPKTDFISLAVETDDELASLFRLRLALSPESDGNWRYLDDERFGIWRRLSFRAGLGNAIEDLMTGYITHVKPDFSWDRSNCSVEIWGWTPVFSWIGKRS